MKPYIAVDDVEGIQNNSGAYKYLILCVGERRNHIRQSLSKFSRISCSLHLLEWLMCQDDTSAANRLLYYYSYLFTQFSMWVGCGLAFLEEGEK